MHVTTNKGGRTLGQQTLTASLRQFHILRRLVTSEAVIQGRQGVRDEDLNELERALDDLTGMES